jgi:hypothetical protein
MTETLAERVAKIPTPDRIKKLTLDPVRQIPVPWFVEWINGLPDFRVMDGKKRIQAINFRLCWVCGEKLGAKFAFVVGPMCAVNRVSSEPPSHKECAQYSVKACPFLTMTKMTRRENDLPEGAANPGGEMICRNPGVSLIWHTKDYKVVKDERGGFVLRMGESFEVEWWKEGRRAKRAEILESIESGLPLLSASIDEDPSASRRVDSRLLLQKQYMVAMKLVPAA